MSPPPPRRRLADRRPSDPAHAIEVLLSEGVAFVIVGGVAAIAHGVQRTTRDLDLLLDPSIPNCRQAITALARLEAEEYRPRAKRWVKVERPADARWLLREPRFFDTAAGGVDVCNAMAGAPDWAGASERAILVQAFELEFRVLDLDSLIRSKLAAGREKDLQDVAELGALEEGR